MHLAEYRTRPALLADWLPWAGLVAPGVVLNKDGSFQRTARFRVPDLDITVIALQQGEELATESAVDTVRWIVGDTASGAGTSLGVNILVKPTRIGLKTNLVITTNRRTYLLELSSTPQAWMASASWDYPKDRLLALQKQAQQAQASAPVDSGLSLEQIKFRYAISGDSPPWKPLRAFDDGERVYIQFPAGFAQGELPPLFASSVQMVWAARHGGIEHEHARHASTNRGE